MTSFCTHSTSKLHTHGGLHTLTVMCLACERVCMGMLWTGVHSRQLALAGNFGTGSCSIIHPSLKDAKTSRTDSNRVNKSWPAEMERGKREWKQRQPAVAWRPMELSMPRKTIFLFWECHSWLDFAPRALFSSKKFQVSIITF